MMAPASAAALSRGTTCRSSPKISCSSHPPGLSELTTGVPQASASTATVGQASRSDGSTNTSAAVQYVAIVWLSTWPVKLVWAATPASAARRWSSSSSGPEPQMMALPGFSWVIG